AVHRRCGVGSARPRRAGRAVTGGVAARRRGEGRDAVLPRRLEAERFRAQTGRVRARLLARQRPARHAPRQLRGERRCRRRARKGTRTMNGPPRNEPRTAALDAYLARREADGYIIETRTAVQAVIVRRRWDFARRFTRTGSGERRLVVSVDEHGEVSAV